MKNFENWLNENGFAYNVEVQENGSKTFLIGICNGITVFCAKGTRQAQVNKRMEVGLRMGLKN